MAANIVDQNNDQSLSGLMSVFDLASTDDYDNRTAKIEKLHDIYGVDSEHVLEEKWAEFEVNVVFQKHVD